MSLPPSINDLVDIYSQRHTNSKDPSDRAQLFSYSMETPFIHPKGQRSNDLLNECIQTNEKTKETGSTIINIISSQGDQIERMRSRTTETNNLITRANGALYRMTNKERIQFYLKIAILFVGFGVIIGLVVLSIMKK
jgi:hypothetical protein